MDSNFYFKLQQAVSEKDIENVYREFLSEYFNTTIASPYGIDGVLDTNVSKEGLKQRLILIMEFKYRNELFNGIKRAEVLIQVIYYLKKFELDGEIVPNATLIGDQNDTFVIKNDVLSKYLNKGIDWKIAPSRAHTENPDLKQEIFSDSAIHPFVFRIDEEFNFDEVFDKLKSEVLNITKHVEMTKQNISKIYDYFIKRVISDYTAYDPNKLVSIFITLMLNEKNSYIHPKKRNILIIDDDFEVRVDRSSYDAFREHFQRKFKPAEKRKFTAIADRLILETKRRYQGEFYTPTAFVDYSHKLLEKHLGEDWKKKFIVWDCAWGTGNLTRDYSFRHLYASTLHESDLAMGKEYNDNTNTTKFQYDFLNDDPEFDDERFLNIVQDNWYEEKLPQSLSEHFKVVQKPILFFINPPYGTGGNANAKNVDPKFNLSRTVMGGEMNEQKLKVSEQLYAQFLYRIIRMKKNLSLENVYIGLYSPTLFLTGQKYDKFRNLFLSEFEFVEGSIFKASNFADVTSNWAIGFSIWRAKPKDNNIPHSFKFNILEVSDIGEVEETGHKILWNLDNDLTLQEWLIDPKDKDAANFIDQVCFSSAFNYSERIRPIRDDALGFFINDTNNIEASVKGCYLMPSKINRNIKTITLISENFAQAMVGFTARNIFKPNWMNQKDEFSAPNENHPEYKKFEVLSVVYSIFSPKNNVISYRDLNVNGELYSWENEWFFMSNEEIKDIANTVENDEIYNDAISYAGNRFVYNYLRNNEEYLTNTANELLELAKKIILDTFKYREMFHDENPDLFLNTWDASWAQIKRFITTMHLCQETYRSFNNKFNEFEVQLLEIASNLGFLKYN